MNAALTYRPEHHQFRELVRDFVQQTVLPRYDAAERAGRLDRSLFTEAGKLGLLGFPVPEHLGGPGVEDFRYHALSVGAVAAAEGVMAETLRYVQHREAFGTPIAGFQNSRFVLAELATELDIARTYLDDCIAEHLAGALTASRAARLKWWTTELQVRTADRCLQLHGGYGYMREYPVARAYVDARIETIYGGTTEIMKTIIAKDLGI
jgi:alkylation response protein AidB-like acyl-CoA dehydrogenase